MRSFAIVLLLILTCAHLHGETLVVRQDHPAASDKNPGTDTRPLKTISAAARKVKAGDKVIIHAGEYRETVIITASGTAQRPIVFEAAPNETPVIKGSDVLIGWEQDEGPIWKIKLPTFPPRDPDGKNAAFWNTNDVRQVFTKDATLLEAERLKRVTSRAALKEGTFFCDAEASVLYLWMPNSISPAAHPPEISRRGAWLSIFGNYIQVRGLAMRHAGTSAFANWPACSLQGQNITLENCDITWGDFEGIGFSGIHNRVYRSTIACHGDSGVAGSGERHELEGCRVIFNNIDRYTPAWHAGGAKLIPGFKHGIIRGNEFAHNLGPGLWLDDQCDQNLIEGNYCHNNEGPGIMVEISTGNLIRNNLCGDNHNAMSGTYRDANGKENTVLYSEPKVTPSRLLRPYHAGEGRGILVSSSPETQVLSNTVYRNDAEGICIEGPPRNNGSKEVSTRGSIVMNNISVFNRGAQLTFLPNGTPDQKPLAISDYNLLFAVGAVFAKKGWEGPATFELKDWQTTSGQDAHSIDADPRFAMAAMNDFRLLASSAALGAGKPLAQVPDDYLKHLRDGNKTTMGAFESPALNYPRLPFGSEHNEKATPYSSYVK